MLRINHKLFRTILFCLPTVGLPLILLWAVDINFSELKSLLLVIAGTCLTIAFFALRGDLIGRIASNAQVAICAFFLCFLMIDIVGRIYPDIFPYQIKVFIKNENDQRNRQAVIQYLDHSPWMKFKPDTTIQLPGFRERSDVFSYTWKTDKLGYKNDPAIFKTPIKAVALGDSFTEAMGCSVDNTWEKKLGNKGLSTYSMGVHGYAPSQMAATFEDYGQEFTPQYVFIGYTETIFQREKLFLQLSNEKKEMLGKGGLSAITNLNLLLGHQEVRLVTKSPLLAISMFVLSQKDPFFLKKLSNISFSSAEAKKDVFLRYFNETKYIDNNLPYIPLIGNSPEWDKTTESFLKIRDLAKAKGAKTFIIYFPTRYTAYYNKIFGRPIPPEKDYGNVEKQAILDFCLKNNIGFIDTTPSVKSYIESLPVTVSIDQLPYFEYDMHMSPVGQKIVADTVATALQSN